MSKRTITQTNEGSSDEEVTPSNDNHVSVGASDAFASAGAAVAAANDDVGPKGPTPPFVAGVAAPRLNDAQIALLKADVATWRRTEQNRQVLKMLDGFDAIATAGGRVKGPTGIPSQTLFCKEVDLPIKCLLKGTPTRRAYDEFIGRFVLVARDGFSAIDQRPSTIAGRVRLFLASVEANPSATIPTNPNGHVSARGVAALAGVSYSELKRNHYVRAEVRKWVADGRVRLGPVYRPVETMTLCEKEARLTELYAVVEAMDVPGGKVPGGIGYMTRSPSFARVAALTGKPEPTMEDDLAYNRFVREVAKRRGTILPGLDLGGGTVAGLRVDGVGQLQREQAEKGSVTSATVVSNHTGALDRLVAARGLTTEDEATALFAEGFEEVVEDLVSNFANARSGSNFRRLCHKWREIHLKVLSAVELPRGFGAALKQMAAARGLSATVLAEAAGTSRDVMCAWVEGLSRPSEGMLAAVAKLEDALKIPRGTLKDRIGRPLRRLHRTTPATDWYRRLGPELRSLLPMEAADWDEARLEKAVTQVRPLISRGTRHGEHLAVARLDENRLPPFAPNSMLAAQIDEFVRYKRANVAYPLIRPTNGRWAGESTVEIRMGPVEGFFRALAAPLGEGPSRGLGVDAASATLAWLANPVMLLAHLGGRASRFGDLEWQGKLRGTVYSRQDVGLLSLAASMTNPATGWLAQRPDLAETLVPIEQQVPPGFDDLLGFFRGLGGGQLLSADDVAFARRDWLGYISSAHRSLVQAVGYLEEVAETIRNPMEPIFGLLAAKEPLAEWFALLFEAERRWALEGTSPMKYRLDVRDSVLARLGPITGFRPENMRGLTFTGDERGEIRKVDGVWKIEVDYRKFKNHRSCRLFGPKANKLNYALVLEDEGGLYTLLDRWFYDCRPSLRTGEHDAAFVSRQGVPLDANSYYSVFKRFGMQHVAWNPVLQRGYPGVTSVNPYAMRHLRATDTLKNGVSYNRVEEAAFAIQTSEEMINFHYGAMIPKQVLQNGYKTVSNALKRAAMRNR